jgi:hypothetical protein
VLQNGQPHTRVLDPTHKHHQWDLGIELTAGRCHLTASHIVALSWCSTSALPKGLLGSFVWLWVQQRTRGAPAVLLQSAFSNQSHDHPALGGVSSTSTPHLHTPFVGSSVGDFSTFPGLPHVPVSADSQTWPARWAYQTCTTSAAVLFLPSSPQPHFPWRFRPKASECLSVT